MRGGAGRSVAVHGWIYDVADGLLRDLRCTASTSDELTRVYDRALEHTAKLVARKRGRMQRAYVNSPTPNVPRRAVRATLLGILGVGG